MLPEQVSGEMFPYHGERKKAEVSGGFYPSVQPLYPHRYLGIRSPHCVSRGYSKNTRQSPHNQTETTLLLSVWLHQKYDQNHVGAGDPPLNLGIPSAGMPDQRPAAAMGGLIWNQPLPLKHTGQENTTNTSILLFSLHPQNYGVILSLTGRKSGVQGTIYRDQLESTFAMHLTPHMGQVLIKITIL